MMTSAKMMATLAAACFLFSAPAAANDDTHHFKVGNLVIHKPWSRATPKAAKVGAGYLKIENKGGAADTLLKVESAIAGHAEVHEMKVTDGVMKMRRLEGGVDIPAGGSITLKPGANHIMFMKLTSPIKTGEPFKATLTFEKAGTVEVKFKTVKIGGTPKKAKRGSH